MVVLRGEGGDDDHDKDKPRKNHKYLHGKKKKKLSITEHKKKMIEAVKTCGIQKLFLLVC